MVAIIEIFKTVVTKKITITIIFHLKTQKKNYKPLNKHIYNNKNSSNKKYKKSQVNINFFKNKKLFN